MKRRTFLVLIAGAAMWPSAVHAQQTMRRVGILYAGGQPSAPLLGAFRDGLAETGFREGRNVAVEDRWANNALDKLPELVADLVRRGVAVIATPGSYQAALAAKSATATIPIVFSTGVDPVQAHLVESLNRPGGNITGVNYMQAELAAKQLGLLHELLPNAKRFAVLVDPDNPVVAGSAVAELQTAAAAIGVQIAVLRARSSNDIDRAFAAMSENHTEALLVSPGPLSGNRRVQLVTLAANHSVPAMFYDREFSEIGGLISYGSSLVEQYRQTGVYTGRVLKGENPKDMPVMQATKFELVINISTARALKLDVPAMLLSRADEVIE